jgi:IclR family mhp operon transcriptional activator
MMVVQESTHSRSPLSVDRDMVGREVPMLRTASGRVYLAFCPQAERREILRLLRVRGDAADEPYLFPGAVEELLLQCRKKCYGARLNEEFLPKTSSVALPIMINGYARASISVHWPTAAIPAPKAVQQFVPQLAEVAEMLSRRLTAAQWFPHDAGSAEEPRC